MVNGISADQLRGMIRDGVLVPTLCTYEDAVAVLDMIPIMYDDIEMWNAVIVSDVFEPQNREHHRAVLNSLVADFNEMNDIDHMNHMNEVNEGSVVVVADDGEEGADEGDDQRSHNYTEETDSDSDSDASESSSIDAHAIGYMRIHRVLDTLNSNISMSMTISLVTWATTTLGIVFMFASMWQEIGAIKGNTC
jgi:hypothetical protein